MKGKLLLVLLLIAGAYLYLNWDFQIPDNLSPEQLIDTAKNVTNNPGETSSTIETPSSSGTETSGEDLAGNVSVVSSGNWTVIQFETSVIDGSLPGALYTLAEKARENGSENIRVEAYFGDEPILAISIENGDFDNPLFEDIRRPEFRIETDLGLFDVLVHNVTVTNDTASVSLEYLAGEDSFWRDYARMSLAVLEDAPWVERVEIIYLGERNVSISVSSKDLLKALSGNITPKEFADAVKIVELEKK
ncbi:hypothetical protein VFC49_09765 [Thermococcus sp. SY098]|uniref:hypothetical protein n=1 Tax=Thermococcus sp. SY098 TaxID=3111325 RepID=UPI002D793138|nr:hypothetical protein [Thermococcus sp. SY098]WRS52322.1 hypothetical protein VFC49_09765 [Thermococcus sp. SY098]